MGDIEPALEWGHGRVALGPPFVTREARVPDTTWLQIRIPVFEKRVIARAAKSADLSITDLTRKSALAAAEAILKPEQPEQSDAT
jgi:hypothetical protein